MTPQERVESLSYDTELSSPLQPVLVLGEGPAPIYTALTTGQIHRGLTSETRVGLLMEFYLCCR